MDVALVGGGPLFFLGFTKDLARGISTEGLFQNLAKGTFPTRVNQPCEIFGFKSRLPR